MVEQLDHLHAPDVLGVRRVVGAPLQVSAGDQRSLVRNPQMAEQRELIVPAMVRLVVQHLVSIQVDVRSPSEQRRAVRPAASLRVHADVSIAEPPSDRLMRVGFDLLQTQQIDIEPGDAIEQQPAPWSGSESLGRTQTRTAC